MTSAPLASAARTAPRARADLAAPVGRDERRPRLSVKSAGSVVTGQVDGAWWPYSRDLVGELDGLLRALAARLGRIERVSYRLGEWDPAARKVDIDGARIRLGGFYSKAAHTVDVLAERHRLTLLVIPPDTAFGLASSVLEIAGADGNANRIDELLSAVSAA